MAAYKECPCHFCTVHTSICRLMCKEYKDWKAEDLELKAIEQKARHAERLLESQRLDGKEKNNKRRGYRW